MGETTSPADRPEDDDIDWVRLYALAPNLWRTYLGDLEDNPSAAELARFADRCIRSVRCLTDLHARLPEIGLTLAAFAELHERAWTAQYELRLADDHHDVPIGDEETKKERRGSTRCAEWPDPRSRLRDVLSEEMRDAVVNLHLRGLDDDRITCALDIPRDWPVLILADEKNLGAAEEVVRTHLDGRSLGQIAKVTGVPATTALRILRRIGEKPHGAAARVDARDRARTIVKLRAKGLTYKEIARRVGCDLDDVKNALRRDRRHRYGEGRAAE